MRKQKCWQLEWDNEQFGTVILCKDGFWRKCPDYGDYKECVRLWTSSNWALRFCRNWRGSYYTRKISEQSEEIVDRQGNKLFCEFE
jgi:hypothetical protein